MIYRVDIQLCATAYVKAKSKAAALEKAEAFSKEWFTFDGDHVCDKRLDDPSLPEISLSPAMTGHGIWPGATIDKAT